MYKVTISKICKVLLDSIHINKWIKNKKNIAVEIDRTYMS